MRHVRPAMVTALVLGSLSSAARADLELIYTGTFDTGTTVGTTTLAAPATFSLDAIFDPTSGVPVTGPGLPAGTVLSVFTFTLATIDVSGIGTIALEPSAGTYVFFAVIPGSGGAPTLYEAGVSDVTNLHGFGSGYTTSSDPAFQASAPTPTVFGGYVATAVEPFSFPVVGGGVLANPNFALDSEGATAEIVAVGVPEPSTLVLTGLGLAGVIAARRTRRRSRETAGRETI